LRDGRITCTGRWVVSAQLVAGITDATSYATSDFGDCAVRADHAVWCWSGQWMTSLTESTGPSTARDLSVPAKVKGLADVTQVVMGQHDFAYALNRDGSVWCFGDNDVGQLGDGTFVTRPGPARVANLGDVIALAAGDAHVCALRKTGTVACWGDGSYGQIGTYVTSEIPDPQAVIW
jgi:alpha-tubulin suppressor-like RCC1 family protein